MHRSLAAGTLRWTTRAGWAALIAAAPRDDLDPAVVRLAAGIMVLLYAVWALGDLGPALGRSPGPLWTIVGYVIFIATIILWALSVPQPSPVRRILVIAADNAAITYCMLVSGEAGAVVSGIYLFVIFGNGLRYGRSYFLLSQALALLGFVLVLSVSDFWSKHLSIGMGFVITLIIIPIYVGMLAERMKAAHLKTRQALNECEDREQRRT